MKLSVTPEALADAVRDLDGNADLSVVREAIDEVEACRIKALLRATADVELMKPTMKGRRFIVVYWHEGKVHSTYGVVYIDDQPKKSADADEDVVEGYPRRYGVLVDDYNAPFCGHYVSMERFKDALNRHKSLFVIRYID